MQQSEKEAIAATAPVPALALNAKKQASSSSSSIRYPFWFGGSASCMAACVTHPLDLDPTGSARLVRLQMRSGDMPRSMLGTVRHILGANGIPGLYHGLSASLLRQLTYSTVRFGIYEEVKTRLTVQHGGAQPPFAVLVALSCAAGFVGGVAGNPADICNVRMQHDAVLPHAQRRNYNHALHGIAAMARDEGPASWFRGVLPNGLRAAAMTASQLASYDIFKRLLIAHTPMADNLATHFTASFLAGVVAATVTSPVDVVKTRIMSQSGKSVGLVALLKDITAAEGLGWMFRGWVPSFLRLGP
ncbi:hypothetical protein VSDG_00795 [Cytospora chrysosperma]|uniref:Mitochondrial dicarboxylate carrier n=1 Tax=Cytospora chrysosperma TaxID=252740 RepID=A0A423WLT2_CYTCH|nr:hypothetical protein VSDG_00795 [Valsa sordida]